MEGLKEKLIGWAGAGLVGAALLGNPIYAEAGSMGCSGTKSSVKQLKNAMKAYAYDKGELPASAKELVENGYLKEVPTNKYGKKLRIEYWRSGRLIVDAGKKKSDKDDRFYAVHDLKIIGTDKWSYKKGERR